MGCDAADIAHTIQPHSTWASRPAWRPRSMRASAAICRRRRRGRWHVPGRVLRLRAVRPACWPGESRSALRSGFAQRTRGDQRRARGVASGMETSRQRLIEQHREEVVALCRRAGVRRLDALGSAIRVDLAPASSDVDFLRPAVVSSILPLSKRSRARGIMPVNPVGLVCWLAGRSSRRTAKWRDWRVAIGSAAWRCSVLRHGANGGRTVN